VHTLLKPHFDFGLTFVIRPEREDLPPPIHSQRGKRSKSRFSPCLAEALKPTVPSGQKRGLGAAAAAFGLELLTKRGLETGAGAPVTGSSGRDGSPVGGGPMGALRVTQPWELCQSRITHSLERE